MDEIFISYANVDRDKAKARALASFLKNEGYSVFWDRVIRPGETWDEEIERALGDAKAVIVLWSQAAIRSTWVKLEAGVVVDRGVLVPALIERVKPPLRFQLIQAADLCDWDGSTVTSEIENLLESVRRLTESSPPLKACDLPRAGQASHSNRPARPRGGILALVVSSFLLILATVWVLDRDDRLPGVPVAKLPEPSGLIAKCERPEDRSYVTLLCKKMHGHFVGYWSNGTYVGRMEFRYALFFVVISNAVALFFSTMRRPASAKETLSKVGESFLGASVLAYVLTWPAILIEGWLMKGNGPLSVPWVVSTGVLGSFIYFLALSLLGKTLSYDAPMR